MQPYNRLRAVFHFWPCLTAGPFLWMFPMHWSDRFVGQAYIPKSGDCVALAAKVAREVFGIEPSLPMAHASTYRDQAKQIMEHKDVIAERLDKPVDGCLALFIGRGRLCHVGVVCLLANEIWILHADQSCGFVIRQRLRDMTRIHFKLEAYYKWK